MNRTNVEFLKAQLSKAIGKILSKQTLDSATIDLELKFKILFDEEEVKEPITNMDEIMYYHTIPKLSAKEITLDEVSEILITGLNEMPLWIKLNYVEGYKLITLKISKRFRKKKVVQEWHGASDLLPVLIDESLVMLIKKPAPNTGELL